MHQRQSHGNRDWRWVLVIMLQCCWMVWGIGLAQAADLADLQRRGELRVGVPLDYPPFGTVAPDLTPIGYDIDTAHYLAQGLGLTLVLVPVTSANRVAYLVSGRVDLVISSLGSTPERARTIAFSLPYAPFFFGVFSARPEPAWASAAQLAGKTIGATRGALEEIELSAIAPLGMVIKRYEDNVTTLSAFTAGQVDYIATGTPIAAALALRGGARVPHAVLMLKNSPCVVGMRKEAVALKRRVDELITTGLADGTFDGLSRRWLGIALPDSMRAAAREGQE